MWSKNLSSTKGPNPSHSKGANDTLLLLDYIDWQGPDSTFRNGPQGLAKGANSNILSVRSYRARGPNLELRHGPKLGLAKGSTFSQLKTAIVGESLGK